MAQGGSGGIRQFIGLTGNEEVLRAFKSLGAVGEQAFKDISRAAEASAGNVGRFGASTKTAEAGVRSLSRTVSGALSGLESFKAGITAVAGAEGVRLLTGAFTDTISRMNELRNTSTGTGFSQGFIKLFQNIAASSGLAGEKLSGALVQFATQYADAGQKAGGFNQTLQKGVAVMKGAEGSVSAITQGVAVMRGDMKNAAVTGNQFVEVIRGGVKPAVADLSDPFKVLGIDVSKLAQGAGSLEKGLVLAARQFVALKEKDPSRVISALSKLLGEDDIAKFADTMKELAAIPDDQIAKLVASLTPSPDAQARVKAISAEYAKLKLQIQNLQDTANTGWLGSAVELELKGANNFVKGLRIEFGRIGDAAASAWTTASNAFVEAGFLARNQQELDKMTASWKAWGTNLVQTVWPPIKTEWDMLMTNLSGGWKQTLPNMQAAWDELWAGMKSTAQSVIDTIAGWLSSLSSSLGKLPDNALTSGFVVPGMATGGMVRGPGTGKSDSVLARLSAGEFVMKTAAVDHWGPRFMHALNNLRNPSGYAEGGLVGLGSSLLPASSPRFAEGGLAAAETGTPVHLHLGGASFQLRGDKAVTEALVREARRAQMLSGSRAPGAFAAA